MMRDGHILTSCEVCSTLEKTLNDMANCIILTFNIKCCFTVSTVDFRDVIFLLLLTRCSADIKF